MWQLLIKELTWEQPLKVLIFLQFILELIWQQFNCLQKVVDCGFSQKYRSIHQTPRCLKPTTYPWKAQEMCWYFSTPPPQSFEDLFCMWGRFHLFWLKRRCNNCDWLIVKPVFSGQCPPWNSMETRNGSQIVSSTERKGELVKTLTNSESNPPKNQVKTHFFIWWRAADVEPSIKQGQLHKTLIIGIWWP